MKGLIFTYVLTYGGAVISLFNPYYGFLIYTCFTIVKPPALWYWSVPPGPYVRIIAVALLVGWGLNGFGNWRFGRGRGMVFALIGFFLWSLASAVTARDQYVAWDFEELLAKIVLPLVAGITMMDSVKRLKQFIWVIVLSQGYLAYDLNMSYFNGYNRLREEGFGWVDNNSVAISIVACLGPALFLGLHTKNWFGKAAAFGAAAFMGHAVLISFSRGGMLAVIVTVATAFMLVPRKPVHYLLLVTGALIGLQLAGPEVRARFATTFASEQERDSSAQSRIQLWENMFDLTLKNPVLGAGPRHWPLYAESDYDWGYRKEGHSLWLQIGSELGFPGLFLLMAFYGLCVVRLWPLTREWYPANDPWFRYFARMIVAGVVGFAVAAQFVSLYQEEVPYFLATLGAGVLKVYSAAHDSRTGVPARPATRSHPASQYALSPG
jgi:probable O-glycosylation ligase (exosortase A-associated)